MGTRVWAPIYQDQVTLPVKNRVFQKQNQCNIHHIVGHFEELHLALVNELIVQGPPC